MLFHRPYVGQCFHGSLYQNLGRLTAQKCHFLGDRVAAMDVGVSALPYRIVQFMPQEFARSYRNLFNVNVPMGENAGKKISVLCCESWW